MRKPKTQTHLEISNALRKRSLHQFRIAHGLHQTINDIIPNLEQGVRQIRSAVTLDKTVLPEIEKTLDKMTDYIRALKEAHELETVALNQVEAATGHLQEAASDIPAIAHEAANLAALMQYYDVAVESSEEFWIEVLGKVKPSVYASAWHKTTKGVQDALSDEVEAQNDTTAI